MSYTPTFTTNNGVGCQSTSGDQKVGLSDGGITIDYNLNSIPHKHFTLTHTGVSWNDGTTSYSTGLERLTAIQQAFSSIELPPNTSTLKVNNTILLDAGTSETSTLTNTSLSFTGSNTTDINLNGTDFRIDGNGNRVLITTPLSEFYAGDPFGSNTGTTIGLLETNRWILLNAVDTTTTCGSGNHYIIPVNFTNKWSSGYAYNSAGSWEMVRRTTISLPNEYFTLSNSLSQTWKIEVAFNCFNMSDQTNKDYAMYLELIDDNGATYQGFAFNQNTPFTTYKNGSTYSATSSQVENYCWTDYYDLTGFANGNIEIQLWRFANTNMTTDFNAVITFSKTNLV